MVGAEINYLRVARLQPDPDRYVPVGDHMGECRAHGVVKRVRPEDLDRWAEEDLERSTTDGMLDACPVCGYCISRLGVCECGDLTGRIMRAAFGLEGEGEPPPEMVREPVPDARPRPVGCWIPTSAELPDLPEDATPEQVAEWRDLYGRMREFRGAQLANTYDPFSKE